MAVRLERNDTFQQLKQDHGEGVHIHLCIVCKEEAVSMKDIIKLISAAAATLHAKCYQKV